MLKYTLYIVIGLLFMHVAQAQKKVTYLAEDGLLITADLYLKDKQNPFIILLHQSDYSRGEYIETAKKLLNLNYNCLAVDLRHGNKCNYIVNETAKAAKELGYAHETLDARHDIKASVDYIYRVYQKPVILFGSSYSASLALIEAQNNFKIKAVVAFSPGEYFRPDLIVKNEIVEFDKPVFIASSVIEKPYVDKISNTIPDSLLTAFTPSKSKGQHGSKALWESSDSNKEYWLELLMFFKKLK